MKRNKKTVSFAMAKDTVFEYQRLMLGRLAAAMD